MNKTLLLIVFTLLYVHSIVAQPISLAPRAEYLTGTAPHSVVIGDINGDGKPDLVAANYNSDNISVLFNDGSGSFPIKRDYGVGTTPRTVVIGDVNGDGKLDAVVANVNSNNVSVLLNDGTGSFLVQQTYAVGGAPHWVALGDVNRDGKPDIVTVNQLDNTISVLLGNGNGSFQSQQTYPAGLSPHAVALADLNNDNNLDVVTANFDGNDISVLLGNGNGSFQSQQTYPIAVKPAHVALGDVNGDGKLDAVTADPFAGTISVLLGNGNGSFSTPQNYASGSFTSFVALGDLNSNNKLDVVAANRWSDNISVFEGDGSGAFPAKTDYSTGPGQLDPFSVALGDLNGDSKPDVAVANWNGTGNIVVFLQKKDQTVTFNPLAIKTYGDADFDPGASASSGLTPVYSSSNPSVATIVAGKVHIVGAGTSSITASQPGNDYYMPATGVQQTLTVNPKPVTVTAGGQSKVYGTSDPALTYTVSPALISGDVFTGALSRTPGESVGTYAIQQNTLVLSNNYVLNYTGADLTITPKAVTIAAEAKSKTYGDGDPALTYTYTPALVGSDAFSGSLSRTPGEDVGSYVIDQGSLALNSNYTLTYKIADLTINQKAITVAADSKAKTYGDADPAFTYSYTPALVGSDAFSGTLSRVVGEDVGSHAITQGSLTLNNNYTLSYTGANLVIGQKAVTVTADAKSKVYGEADPALTFTSLPAVGTVLANGDQMVFNGALSRVAGENAGTYPITQGNLANPNYAISFVNGVFAIDKSAQQITWMQTLIDGCNGTTTIVLTATSSSGLPVSYSSDNTSVATIQTNQLTLASPGTAVITASQSGNSNYFAATEVQKTLTSKLPAYLQVPHWNDVLLFDNSSRQYTAWQWYKNGAMVPGATGAYYAENAPLNGTYYVVVKTTNGTTLETCPVTLTAGPTPIRLGVYPNPVTAGRQVTVKTDYDEAALGGATLQLSDVRGVVLQMLTTVKNQTQVAMPVMPGVYILRLRLSNGVTHSVNVLVKP